MSRSANWTPALFPEFAVHAVVLQEAQQVHLFGLEPAASGPTGAPSHPIQPRLQEGIQNRGMDIAFTADRRRVAQPLYHVLHRLHHRLPAALAALGQTLPQGCQSQSAAGGGADPDVTISRG